MARKSTTTEEQVLTEQSVEEAPKKETEQVSNEDQKKVAGPKTCVA